MEIYLETELTALAFINDPDLLEIHTLNGKVEFIQLVGITVDELDAMQIWNTLGVLNACSKYMPQYITNLSRKSLLQNSKIKEAIQKGSEKEGSNTGFLFNEQVTWTRSKKFFLKKNPAVITIGAKQAKTIGQIIRGRMVKGEPFRLVSNEATVIFMFKDQPQVIEKDDKIEIILSGQVVEQFVSQLEPVEKSFSIPSLKSVVFQIIKTEVKDSEGNVVETIG